MPPKLQKPKADSISIDLQVSKTQGAFIDSKAFENLLVGPRGEGKSTAGVMAMTQHAIDQAAEVRPIPWAIVRDTFSNLEETTLKAIMKSPLSAALRLSDGNTRLDFPGLWTAKLMGIDSLADLSKLQGGEYGGIWFEECAPAATEDIGNGIQAEAWEIALTSLRYPCAQRGQITENYPDEDHWTWKRFVLDPVPDSGFFEIQKGENPFLPKGIRERWERALKNRPDLARRLLEGKPGTVQLGVAVTSEFIESQHVAKEPLTPFEGGELIMMWDFGLNPTCLIAQITPSGHLHFFDAVVGDDIGVERLIRDYIKPLFVSRYPWKPLSFYHLPDPSGKIRSQANEITAYNIIEEELGGRFDDALQWPGARECAKSALNRWLQDKRWVQIDKVGCRKLIRALNGGWHYFKSPSGQVIRDKPVKDKWSHPGDAFAGGVGIISGDYLQFNPKKRHREWSFGQLLGDLN